MPDTPLSLDVAGMAESALAAQEAYAAYSRADPKFGGGKRGERAGWIAYQSAVMDFAERATPAAVASLCAELTSLRERVARGERDTARGSENRPELPGPAELQLSDWSQAETCPGGRADDALLSLYAGKKYVGSIPLGWFREHTTFDLYERAIVENRNEDAALPPSRETNER